MERSLPRERENSRKSAVITAQTVCEPVSRLSVSQQPLRNHPVLGVRLHGVRGSPNTFTWGLSPPPLPSMGRKGTA